MNDRRRTDPKHPDDITYATAVERQVHDSLFDLWQASGIVVLQQKDAPRTVRIVTPIALGAIRLLAIFDHGDPVTLGGTAQAQPPSSFSLEKRNVRAWRISH